MLRYAYNFENLQYPLPAIFSVIYIKNAPYGNFISNLFIKNDVMREYIINVRTIFRENFITVLLRIIGQGCEI